MGSDRTNMAPKDYLGKDQRNVADDKEKKVDDIKVLDAGDILLLKTYGQGPYAKPIKAVEDDIQKTIKRVNELTGIKSRIQVWPIRLCGIWPPINKHNKTNNHFKWPGAQRSLVPIHRSPSTSSTSSNLPNSWLIWVIRWHQPTLKKACESVLIGKSTKSIFPSRQRLTLP